MSTVQEKKVTVQTSLGFQVICKSINEVLFADFSTSDQWMPEEWKKGTIIFNPLMPAKMNVYSFAKFADVESGVQFAMLHPALNKNKEVSYDKIEIKGRQEFNLGNKQERIKAFILYYQDWIKGGPNANEYCLMEVINVKEKVNHDRLRRKTMRQALRLIDELEGTALYDFARLLIPVKPTDEPDMLKSALEEIAEDTPDVILTEWNRSDRVTLEILRRAEKANVIEYYQDIGYKYGQLLVGLNTEEAVKKLKEDRQMCQVIHKKSLEIINGKIDEMDKKLKQAVGPAMASAMKNSPGDRSVSDSQAMHPDEKTAEQNIDFMAMMNQMKEMVSSAIDQKVSPLLQEFQDIKKKVDDINFIDEVLDGHDEAEEALQNRIDDANAGIIKGKTEEEWKLAEIRSYVKEAFNIDEYADHITKNKPELYKWLCEQVAEKLEKGILV